METIEEYRNALNELWAEHAGLTARMRMNDWMNHESKVEPEWLRHLPLPRMEMRFSRRAEDWYTYQWVYGLVYRHFTQDGTDKVAFIPFGATKGEGGGDEFEDQLQNGLLPTPFRDSLHLKLEAKMLNLPAFVVCLEKEMVQPLGELTAENVNIPATLIRPQTA